MFSFALLSSGESLVDIGLSSSNDVFNDVVPFFCNDQESGHGLNLVGLWELFGLFDVDFDQRDVEFLALLIHIRSDSLAWTTPGSIAVNNGDSIVSIQEALNLCGCGGFNFRHCVKGSVLLK
jgi:hypothetical protein